ncbi:MAG TPA: hypothetical protein VNY05_05810 [Candidatus Acidoferrales bacterium]|jgi:virginiamycin B lyase|nr:hypothetical protein [Candidatus Acidoferrales bacterium]
MLVYLRIGGWKLARRLPFCLLLTCSSAAFGQISTREFLIPGAASSQFNEITSGPDGNLWFTENSNNKIGRMTTGGVVTEFALATPNSFPRGIATGSDGNIWFTEMGVPFANSGRIGRITPAGVITEFTVLTLFSTPTGITPGPDGNLWFH